MPVNRIAVVTHALSGLLTTVAGLLVTARLAAAVPSIGEDWLLTLPRPCPFPRKWLRNPFLKQKNTL
ncbi:hypothetical protein [Mesorhizobium sp. KR9-304]|uniref:hypothetical protein n=1 Tax=Mesorhizobium sp. KR9-304 TaxID=3156614 RepID=UPI0032B384FC